MQFHVNRAPPTARYSTLHVGKDCRRASLEQEDLQRHQRRAFAFGYQVHPERRDPAATLRSARIGKKDRPLIDPFSIQDAETLIAALHRDWGEAQGNYDEFQFFAGLRPSEQIALVVT